MPVTVTHPQYDEHSGQWTRIDDCLSGLDAIRKGTTAYLPMLAGQIDNPAAYEAYQKRATFFGATGRTLEALLGAIFRKDPTWTVSSQLEKRMENFDGRGNTVYTFTQKLTKHVLSKGRYGVFLDMPSQIDLRDPASRVPFFCGYSAQNIRSWRTREVNGVPKLDQVILQEWVQKPAARNRPSMRAASTARICPTLNVAVLAAVAAALAGCVVDAELVRTVGIEGPGSAAASGGTWV